MRERNLRFLARVRNLTPRAVALQYRGDLTSADIDRWWRLWVWSAPRFSGAAAEVQDRYCKRFGALAYHRRMARARRLFRGAA